MEEDKDQQPPPVITSPAPALPPPMAITSSSFTDGRHITPFKIDGVVKTIAGPVGGRSLYEKAGNPPYLMDGDKIVPNTWHAYTVAPDTNLITRQTKPDPPPETSPA